jgi:hypothetical protein
MQHTPAWRLSCAHAAPAHKPLLESTLHACSTHQLGDCPAHMQHLHTSHCLRVPCTHAAHTSLETVLGTCSVRDSPAHMHASLRVSAHMQHMTALMCRYKLSNTLATYTLALCRTGRLAICNCLVMTRISLTTAVISICKSRTDMQ